MNNNDFKANVYNIVRDIPSGYVLTYGMIAMYCGRPQNSRLVGRFLSQCPKDVPAHRVVNHKGGISKAFPQQRQLLKQEGVTFKANGMVDMKKHRWKP